MTSSSTDPNDLIDPEAPAIGGATVDTAAYAGAPETKPAPDLAHPGAADITDVEADAIVVSDPPPLGMAGHGAYAGEGMEPPPRADLEFGGGAATSDDVMEAAVDALLDLCTDRPWRDVSLRDVGQRAGISFAALYAKAPGKAPLLARLSDRYDRAALRVVDGDLQPQAHDRLFEAFMARLEAMAPRRDVLIAIGRAEPLLASRSFGRTTQALTESAGVDTSGGRGALRLLALTGVWARTLQVWRDDEGALNRTMAEIDSRLRQAARRLERLGAGF